MFTANGRSDHVTMFSPCLLLTVCHFQVKVSSFALVINTRTILHYSCEVGRHEGSCCRDMLQQQKTCVVYTEVTCSRDV